jgi:hypothetical protein
MALFPPSANRLALVSRPERRLVVKYAAIGLAMGPGVLALNLLASGKALTSFPLTTWALATLAGGALSLLAVLVSRMRHATDAEEEALIERAASEDERAARELAARGDLKVAVLREQAQSSRRAARKYLDHLTVEIQALRDLERDFAARDDPQLLERLRTDIRRLEAEATRVATLR